MIIYFKCSFRSSHGFTLSSYDTKTNQLCYLSEKSRESGNVIPKTIEYTLSHQLGRCFILATDENGDYFFGVYRLIEGNDDKYVNAVFYDNKRPQNIITIYEYFCNNQKKATTAILDSIKRANLEEYAYSNLEYIVRKDVIKNLFSGMFSDLSEKNFKMADPNSVLAFITTDEYSDYQITIEDKFSTAQMFLCEKYNANDENVANYQQAIKQMYKLFSSVKLPVVIGGGIGLIIILLILLL